MRLIDRYPIVITTSKDACRDFWQRYFGLRVGFDSSWFVWLASDSGDLSIAFMTPDHPSAPPGPQPFSGQGLCLELQVEDAAGACEQLRAKGLRLEHPLTDEAFGQRRFGFTDPSGLWVDVVEQIEPERGYWDRYCVPA